MGRRLHRSGGHERPLAWLAGAGMASWLPLVVRHCHRRALLLGYQLDRDMRLPVLVTGLVLAALLLASAWPRRPVAPHHLALAGSTFLDPWPAPNLSWWRCV